MPGGENDHILVVDDDATSRRLLQRILREAKFACRECADGGKVLAAVREHLPSLILLDFELPGLNGAEVLRSIRRDPDPSVAQLPVIMLTGHGGEESEVLCLEAGADDFVTKPINAAVLRARIETHRRLRLMRHQLQTQNNELEAWRRSLEADLAAARLTQQSLIPQKPPSLRNWEVAALYRPVIQVGGDIYGWLRLTDGRTLFWIADATGHGASAALLTTLAKLLFHHGSVEHTRPARIMQAVNADFRAIFGARSFMTAMCVALDPATGAGSVTGAGHPPLLLARGKKPAEMIYSSAPPLGLVEKAAFTEEEFSLEPGDGFLLYTDGLYGTDAEDRRRLGPEHLGGLLDQPFSSAQTLLHHVMSHTGSSVQGEPLADDVAAVVVRRNA